MIAYIYDKWNENKECKTNNADVVFCLALGLSGTCRRFDFLGPIWSLLLRSSDLLSNVSTSMATCP